jgi:molecular chaperone Hsp33
MGQFRLCLIVGMKKKSIFGNTLKEQLKAGARDTMHQFVLADGAVRGALVYGTKLINEMRGNHELGVLETIILGYGYLGGLLLSSSLKGSERLLLEIDCDGPVGGMAVEVNSFGEVRGYIEEKNVPVAAAPANFDISPYLGEGTLSVTRYLEKAKYPFKSRVELKKRNFALNLAYYSLKSEQTPSSYSLSVYFDKTGNVTGAGALLVQAMPGADDELLRELADLVTGIPSIGKEFAEGLSAEGFMLTYFSKYNPRFLHKKRVVFMCHCSKERFKAFLCALPGNELRDMLERGPLPLRLTCYNCNTHYEFKRGDFERLPHG